MWPLNIRVTLVQESYNLQNYSTMLQIISGLKQTSVQRLKDNRADLTPRIKKGFDDLDTQFRPVGNWNSARMLLKTKQPPILPHLGMFLTDLVFIEEGAADIVDGLINFEKHRKIAQMYAHSSSFTTDPPSLTFFFALCSIKQIEGYQNSPFPLEPVPCVREHLINMKVLTQTEITERSNSTFRAKLT